MPQITNTPAKDERIRHGWTLRDLARECASKGTPVDFGQLGRIERGESVPNPALRLVLAELLGLDVADFQRVAR